MLIEYLGSFFSPYWGWGIPWEALIKVTETLTLWKHRLFIVAISFCSNTLTHYRAFLYRTIDPFLVLYYRRKKIINSLKFNNIFLTLTGSEGGRLCASRACNSIQPFFSGVLKLFRKPGVVLQAVIFVVLLVSCLGSLLFLSIPSLWYFHSATISFKSLFMPYC